MTYDVIVVGAGPAGCAAAAGCAALGLKTLCIEEHGTIGYPVQCAGLLSTAAFSECRVSERSVLNKVSGARIVTDSGCEMIIDARKTMAFVVDRGILDFEMAKNAADAGAGFLLKTTVCGIGADHVRTRGPDGFREYGFRVLIAADGPRSTIARMRGIQRPQLFLAGIQADLCGECNPQRVEIYPDASPEFFAWSIPTAPGRIRVGLCGTTGVRNCFRAFLKRFGNDPVHLVTGTLPLGTMPKTFGSRILYIGDAAGFAKPTSGGGIYTGVRSARHAAAVAAEACSNDDFSDNLLSHYEQMWQEDFGRELQMGFQLLRYRGSLKAEDTDALIRAMSDPEIIRTIEEFGDMDRPSRLIKNLLMKPAILRMVAPLVRSGLRPFLK